ncbi:MAG: hypothetical protein ACI3V1_05010 [Faecousia sp.]
MFGALTNSGSYTISGGAVSCVLSGTSGSYGGLIGKYEAKDSDGNPVRSASLCIGNSTNQITITTTGGNNATTYGGVIGTVSKSSYVEIENVTASTAAMKVDKNAYFGGLVGKMEDGLLNVGSVTLTTTESNGIYADDVGGRGGLVGYIVKGVLRLHGTTNLSGQKITAAYHHTGQIVGNNGNGLVYATGSGNDSSWMLKRYSGTDRSGSDIGNWGEVVRLGGTLTEGDGGLLTFDSNAHTVTVHNGNGSNIASTQDFAAYALAFNLDSNTNYPDGNGTLIFNIKVNPKDSQTVTLSGDVNLTGTGILGIGKDGNSDSSQTFTGTFDGGSKTITLDIGGKYGDDINADSGNGSGQIYTRRANGRECHTSLALFPYTSGATISNLTVNGAVNCLIATNGDNSDEKWPVFAAGVVGSAEGSTTFDHVTVSAGISVANEDDNGKSKNLFVMQSGILGQYAGGTTLSFTDCSWTSTLSNSRSTDNNRIGGFAGRVLGGSTVNVSDCTISGTITANSISKNAAVGGLIAESRDECQKTDGSFYSAGNNTISISNLTVSGANISATSATETCGGLLGYKWSKTDVTFVGTGSTGVTISNCNLNANSAKFGGLVYQATGYWNATAANSIRFTGTNTITGGTSDTAPSGLLVGNGLILDGNKAVASALYLEVGTWGSESAAYYIAPNSVTPTLGGNPATPDSYFDELVGVTIQDNAGHDNAVVSLALRESDGTTAAKIDTDTANCNTYKGQIANYKNGKTRYYYNLDGFRENGNVSAGALTTPEKVVSWSVSQYAAENIRGYFCSNSPTGATISGPIDLTGYSYYPVSPLSSVTVNADTLTFAYDVIEAAESNNKKPPDADHQHYLMHHGLLYNTVSGVTVTGTTFKGTAGLQSVNGSTNSGALIFGNISGDKTKTPINVHLRNVTLAGLKVDGVDGNTRYAPLLINTIGEAVTLTVDDLSTGAGYVDDNNNTTYAATSLIGNVGSDSATKLTLTFSDIALDGRTETAKGDTKVYNNGNVKVEYNTTHSIFTRATLLESFQYASEGSGTYNFNSTDNNVTYGVELSNSNGSGRNPDKQYKYYDKALYITDEQNKTNADETYVKNRYTDGNFIRYVHEQQNVSDKKYELNINQKATGLLSGCGTYGDPYIITDPNQLVSLAQYINESKRSDVKDFEAVFNSKVLQDKKQATTSYHIKDGAITDDTGRDTVYKWDGSNWKNADGEIAEPTAALQYLLNAYYKIEGIITLSADKFAGLGTLANPFSGVIVSENNKTISITGTNEETLNFGGLIRYSRGSVVKDLTVDYTGATITMNNTGIPGKDGNNPFFGGVVGYCMGGDTIIDNVSVNYGNGSVSLTGDKARLIAAGGYVGLVGGAKDNGGYEKTGGGVVFRNMDEKTNPFAGNMATNSGAGSTYFYCNPFVGRVLDGYACYDGGTAGQSTLNNTDKNYTIPDVTGNSGLAVSQSSDGSLTATVSTAQGLWLLSAIVNSGAGAMDSTGTYQDVANDQYVDAYQVGKPRTGSYNLIGQAGGDSDLADEAYWGGIASTKDTDAAKNRVSYLVKKFASGANAAHLTGRSNTNSATSANNAVSLTFSPGEINMDSYGNGFRGIGGSYGQKNTGSTSDLDKVQRRSLYVTGVSGIDTMTTIKLAMDQHDYEEEYESIIWSNQGAGLFTVFMYKAGSTDPCQVQNLTISGTVSVRTYTINNNGNECGINKTTYDMGVGGFASRPAKSQNQKLKFSNFHLIDLHVTGGTSTGGAIGLNECAGAIEFNNWSIINTKVYKWVTNDGSTGGFVGWHHSGKSFIINGYGSPSEQGSDRQWNIQNLSVTVQANEQKYGNIGGLTGANDDSEVSITDVNIKGMTVTGIAARDVGGLADGGSSKITVKNCWLEDIEVSGETNSDNKPSGSVGGVLGFCNNRGTTIENVTITGNSSVKSSGGNVGGLIGEARNATAVKDCHITGSSDKPILVRNSASKYAGGLVGKSSNNITISACTETYLNILANGNDAAGLIGKMEGNNVATKASNVAFSCVIVATKNKNNSVGLLTGHTNGKTFNGYNILAEDCTVGYNTTATIDNLGTIISTGTYNGLWFGQSTGTSTLVAVAVKGKNQPQKDVGSGSATVVYADYTAVQGNQPESGTASPWVDVNPKIEIGGLPLTGNGVGYTMTEETIQKEDGTTETKQVKKSCGEVILEKAKLENASKRKYWNVKDASDTVTTFSKFLIPSNDVYLTTYQAEEKGTTDVPDTVDFPILVVNSSTGDADTQIWDYIAALTNVASGTVAQGQAASVTATTYLWKDGSFAAAQKNSLTVSGTYIGVTPNAYDNQKSQFTLLDVTYTDPTNSSNAFHLYVPVLVRKVLDVDATIRILPGTDYRAEDYKDVRNYATAGLHEPVTAYISYSYERTKNDWQALLDAGENLLGGYEKSINLDKNPKLPNGTRLTLVDARTGKMYYKTLNGDTTELNFKDMGVPTPAICDLLGIKAESDTNGKYVITDNTSSDATVRIGTTYYRLATNDDKTAQKFHLSVTKEAKEGYFLTIQIPESVNPGSQVVNNLIEFASAAMDRSGDAPPARIKGTGFRYVLYDGVRQSELTISTKRLPGGKDQANADTEMQNGDAIQITLHSTLSLTEEGNANFGRYAPKELYHQYTIDLKKQLQNAGVSDALLGAEEVSWTYTVSHGDTSATETGSMSAAGATEKLEITYGSEDMVQWLKDLQDNQSLSIRAVVTLKYGNNVGTVFPPRVTGDTESGLYAHAVSRVSNTKTQLPITSNKKTEDGSEHYYTTSPSYATLTYDASAADGDDWNSQLGVNPYDNARSLTIGTDSIYDYSGVEQMTLAKAEKIQYTMELFQKGDTGYGEPLSQIGEYVTVADGTATTVGDNTITWTKDFVPETDAAAGNVFAHIDVTPLTGTKFEEKKFTYANYKIRLTAVMLDSSGKALEDTRASDYIIYTNARVVRELVN